MTDFSAYKSFLFIGKKKFILSIFQSDNKKRIYEEEIFIKDDSNKVEFEKLDFFLENNIYKVEKIIGNFIKDIIIIYESDDLFQVDVSIKNNNSGDLLNYSSLSRPLIEVREVCLKTLENYKIIHMIIENYKINDKSYPFLPKNLRCENFFLDIKFICISENMIKNLESRMKKFQISIDKIISANYLKSFFNEKEKDLGIWAMNIDNGHNKNEVQFHKKMFEKQGFFEKFFNFFS